MSEKIQSVKQGQCDNRVHDELIQLANYIQNAKLEIAAIRPKDISTNHIPIATGELDAIVVATEEATNKIMDVCDIIAQVSQEVPDGAKDKLVVCTTQIFEACNFQDITGQRITKVVSALKHIDKTVEALLNILGKELDSTKTPADDSTRENLSCLLNGPQLPGQGLDQSNIDKLLEEK